MRSKIKVSLNSRMRLHPSHSKTENQLAVMALGRQRQVGNSEFKTNLIYIEFCFGYLVKACFEKIKV